MSAPLAGRAVALPMALTLAELGYYLAPVTVHRDPDTGRKRPDYHGMSWDQASTKDPAEIEAWADHYGPDLGFLVDAAPSGIVVIDLDVKRDQLGAVAVDGLTWWAQESLPTPAMRVDTPSGGQHHYWRMPAGLELPNSTGAIAPGVDVRGVGGHVFAPGTRIVGDSEPYRVADALLSPDDLDELPEEILRRIPPARRRTRERDRSSVGRDVHDEDWLVGECRRQLGLVTAHPAREGTGFRGVLMGAAMVLGRAVAGGVVDREHAQRRLTEAVTSVWGQVDAEDREWIDTGLDDGEADPWTVVPAALDPEAEPDGFEQEVTKRERALLVDREARRRLAAREREAEPGPASTPLPALLAEPDDEPVYRVEDVWPLGGKVVLSAPQKAGKTTTVGNVVRALADADPLFGPAAGDPFRTAGMHDGFGVTPLGEGETIFLADFELDRRMLRRWLRDQGIREGGRVHAESFRGRTWDIRDPEIRASWAAFLCERRTRVIVVDPLAPVLAALGIAEIDNTEVGRFLHALDALTAEAGASELLVVHHTGHSGERSRGAAVLRGWPDAEWRIVREDAAEGREPPPDAARFFAAEGRDVAVRETRLKYDPASRRLTLAYGGRAAYAVDKFAQPVVAIVERRAGITATDLAAELARTANAGRDAARKAIHGVVSQGLVHTHPGPRRGLLHHPGERCSECSE